MTKREEKTMKKPWLCVLFVVVFGLSFWGAATADTLDEIVLRGEIRIACQTQGPPFSFIDKHGKRTGFAIEVAEMMAEEMGVKIKFLDYDWDGLIPALLSKKGDVLAADMTPTLKRALKVSFTQPYYFTGSVIFTKAGSHFKTVEDCNQEGVKVAVLLGSTGEIDAKRVLPRATLKSYKGGGPLLINAVLAGHADIGVNDESAVVGQRAEFPPNSIEILPGKVSQLPLAFAVRPEEARLLQWINLFFDWIRNDGRLDEKLNYWVTTLDWKEDH
jgi:polar amino acid transport system substrate-binding protein